MGCHEVVGACRIVQADFYRAPGPLTTLGPEDTALLEVVDADPLPLCGLAQGLVILPDLASGAGVSDERQQERNIRPAADILRAALELVAPPLDRPRSLDQRVVGTCRHFAVLSCAFLRARGIPARARCGFATYFVPDRAVDHWITEHFSFTDDRWVRVDSEIIGLDLGLVARPDDLAPGEFLTGGEAWRRCRDGASDPMSFGVHGTENWGIGEVIGNAIRDLAALHKVEMLPWDEWGPMEACYRGDIGEAVERYVDEIAEATERDDLDLVSSLYEQVPVPAALVG